MFHNTIDLQSEELVIELTKVEKQEVDILKIFKSNPSKPISPSQMLSIYNKLSSKQVPLTSIRRAMSDLTKDNQLIKTFIKRSGIYHLQEHCWMLNTPENQKYRVGNKEIEEEVKQRSLENVELRINKSVERDLNLSKD